MNSQTKGYGAIATTGLVASFLFIVLWIVAIANNPNWGFGSDLLTVMFGASDDFVGNLFRYGSILCAILLAAY